MDGDPDHVVVQISNLRFRYPSTDCSSVSIPSLTISRGQRWLLAGANGSGKSTLLRILGGRLMISARSVRVLGQDAFNSTPAQVCYIGEPWRSDSLCGGCTVGELLPQTSSSARVQQLVEILGVDRASLVQNLSAGQLRRVQLVCALGARDDFRLYLLDEVTNDLDLIARERLLDWLHRESEIAGATVLLATHILEGTDLWSHGILFLRGGSAEFFPQSDIPSGNYNFVRARLITS